MLRMYKVGALKELRWARALSPSWRKSWVPKTKWNKHDDRRLYMAVCNYM